MKQTQKNTHIVNLKFIIVNKNALVLLTHFVELFTCTISYEIFLFSEFISREKKRKRKNCLMMQLSNIQLFSFIFSLKNM